MWDGEGLLGRPIEGAGRQLIFVGIDAGIRGGAGVAAVDEKGALIGAQRIQRDPQESTIQMFVRVRNRVREVVRHYRPILVSREDHVFPGSLERIARNFLRRQNGALDVMLYDEGYTGDDYLAFPVNTWKAIIGLAGDFGKEHKGVGPGQQAVLGTKSKRNTEGAYLLAMNERLGVQHPDIDSADAHAIALALWTTWSVRTCRKNLWDLPENSRLALWDRERCDSTIHAMHRKHPEVFTDAAKLALCLKTFSP